MNLPALPYPADRPKPIVTLSLDVVTHDTSDDGDDCDDGPSPNVGALDGDSFVIDALFEAMANRRARFVLSYVDSVSVDVLDLEDLADGVAELEVEAGVTAEPEDHRRRIAIDLHHNQLPKLAEAAIVDYDPRSKTVRNWGDDRIETCLELFEAAERS